mmetsp:Transcript_7203/g.14422  ORF Transcript_7203/g.14422 Transcript_7203/m.14422 type:complete len:103 (-) Transcript_7203:320-628(-)
MMIKIQEQYIDIGILAHYLQAQYGLGSIATRTLRKWMSPYPLNALSAKSCNLYRLFFTQKMEIGTHITWYTVQGHVQGLDKVDRVPCPGLSLQVVQTQHSSA